MTTFQQALFHLVLGVVAIVAAVVLALLNKIGGTDALAIVIAVSGISATGVAGVLTGPSASSSPAAVRPPTPPA